MVWRTLFRHAASDSVADASTVGGGVRWRLMSQSRLVAWGTTSSLAAARAAARAALRRTAARSNPSHPDCPGVGPGHQHYQGKCFTDWNKKGDEWRKVWPGRGLYAVVKPWLSSGSWAWAVWRQGATEYAVGNSVSTSAEAAKAAASRFVDNLPRSTKHIDRANPSVGIPFPHTWITKSGVPVSAGDQVEYWSKEGLAYNAKPEKRRATVVRPLVFDDHVVVRRGPFGNVVDDKNFIRVVRRAARRNPGKSPAGFGASE